MLINCYHIHEGNWGMNLVGELVPLPFATVASPPVQTVLVEQGTQWDNIQAISNSNFKEVTLIKDVPAQASYYVDTASYNTNILSCNAAANTNASVPITCPGVTLGSFSVDVVLLTATISYTPLPSQLVGIEYYYFEQGVEPVTPSPIYVDGNATSFVISGLESNITYDLRVRSICARGLLSDWVDVLSFNGN